MDFFMKNIATYFAIKSFETKIKVINDLQGLFLGYHIIDK